MALPKKNQLKGSRGLSELFSETRPLTTENFSLRFTRDKTSREQRFAIVVPAKIIPLASARNMLRRRTSEAVVRIIRKFSVSSGIRAVISIRAPRLPETVAMERELLSLMKKSGILNT